jgi:hypothetical protein
MKKLLSLITFLIFNISFTQEISTEFPKIKLRFESEQWNSEAYETEKVIILDSTPRISYEFKWNDRTILVAIFTGRPNVVGTYIDFANTWQPLHQKLIDYGEIRKELKFYEDDESKFIYFENFIYGGSAGNQSCYFTIYDILNNKIHELKYDGYEVVDSEFNQIRDGKFDFKELTMYPKILALLESEASKSKTIKRN